MAHYDAMSDLALLYSLKPDHLNAMVLIAAHHTL